MNTKIWLEELSFGSNFGNLRAFGSKFWQFLFPVYTFQTKITALDYLYPFLSFSVHNFCARTDGRSDRHFSKKFSFFLLIKNIYTCLYLSRLFLKFHPILTKVSIPFSYGNGYEKSFDNLLVLSSCVVFSAKRTISKATNKMLAKENQFFVIFYKVLEILNSILYVVGTGPCGPLKIIFFNHFES